MSPSPKVLVTGGAGYVGSHTCLRLAEAGFEPVVYDNLSNGHRAFVQWGDFEEGDIRDAARLDEVLAKHQPIAVLHFAAFIEVGFSTQEPGSFYDNNVAGTICLLNAVQRAGIDKVVFSSTCATYGDPQRLPMDETHPQAPLNPYGWSKYMIERVLWDLDKYAGLRSTMLRYFNAAGADTEGRIGEKHDPETHAIPLAIAAAQGRRQGFKIFGTDYETRDGTAVRDYIHVLDLADAHVAALNRLIAGGDTTAFNLGTGTGTTVRELIDAIKDVSGEPFVVDEVGRREGDAPVLVADNAKAARELNWTPKFSLRSIAESAWRWHEQDDNQTTA